MEKMTLNIPNSKYSIEFEKENPFIFKVFRNGERSEVSENSLVGELLNLYLKKTSGCATVETLEQCETQYLPPVPRFISCPSFGQSDGMDGSCHWCKEMTPYQFYMCQDESWLRNTERCCKFSDKPFSREDAINSLNEFKAKKQI